MGRATQAERQAYIERLGLRPWLPVVWLREPGGIAATYIATTAQSMSKVRFEEGPRAGRIKVTCPTWIAHRASSAEKEK